MLTKHANLVRKNKARFEAFSYFHIFNLDIFNLETVNFEISNLESFNFEFSSCKFATWNAQLDNCRV